MSQFEDRHMDFVLKHYQEGKFDTRKALERFNEAHGVRPQPRRIHFRVWSSVAAAAVILLGVFLFWNRSQSQWVELTAEASVQEYALPDGTSVTLAEGSVLRYREDEPRQVKMSGKVYFDVARNEAVPFEVKAEGAFVRVLGTEFQVVDGESAHVYVAEGKVLFAKSPKAEGVILTQGMSARMDEETNMPVLESEPDANAIAWQRGTFVFDQTPLKEVLDCLSDYYKVSFAATDLDKRLSGEFYTDDLDLIIELIESALDVTVIRR